MPTSMDEWSDQHFDRVFALQASQSETVKVFVGLTLAVAGAFVATALQLKSPQGALDVAACICIGLGTLLTALTVIFDRIFLPDRQKMLDYQAIHALDEAAMCRYIRITYRDLEGENAAAVYCMRLAAHFQFLACLGAAIVAMVSCFQN